MTPRLRSHRRGIGLMSILVAPLLLGTVMTGSAPEQAVPRSPDTKTVLHVLNRVTFGPGPGDVERVKSMGISAYLEEQLHPERVKDAALDERLAGFKTLTKSSGELARDYFQPAMELRRDQQLREQRADARAAAQTPTDSSMSGGEMMAAGGDAPQPPRAAVLSPEQRQAQIAQQTVLNELTQAKMLRAATSDRQLQEVMADFWFNHFNVFVGKGQVRQFLTEYEREAIRPNALGRFRTLLGAVAHSPAMLFYLDNFQSTTPNPAPIANPRLDDRLRDPRLTPEQRRRLMDRLQTQARPQAPQPQRPQRGLNENYARELMELHTLGVDGGYTQQDVIELARILTGWTIDRPQQGGSFVFRPQAHDNGTKKLLGQTFGPAGESEGEFALDLLAKHSSTARHIAYKLAQRFVADEPPPALVDRAAKKFLDTQGDIREVVRVILTSPEFFAPAAYRAKVKTPLEFVVSAVRATGATLNQIQPLVLAMRNLAMPLYGCQPPTGYSMTADAWVNTGALLNRMNFAVQLTTGGRIQPTAPPERPNAAAAMERPAAARAGQAQNARRALLNAPIRVDLASLAPDTSAASRDLLLANWLGGDVSETTRQTLARAEGSQQLVALALGSPEFQRR